MSRSLLALALAFAAVAATASAAPPPAAPPAAPPAPGPPKPPPGKAEDVAEFRRVVAGIYGITVEELGPDRFLVKGEYMSVEDFKTVKNSASLLGLQENVDLSGLSPHRDCLDVIRALLEDGLQKINAGKPVEGVRTFVDDGTRRICVVGNVSKKEDLEMILAYVKGQQEAYGTNPKIEVISLTQAEPDEGQMERLAKFAEREIGSRSVTVALKAKAMWVEGPVANEEHRRAILAKVKDVIPRERLRDGLRVDPKELAGLIERRIRDLGINEIMVRSPAGAEKLLVENDGEVTKEEADQAMEVVRGHVPKAFVTDHVEFE